MTAQWTQRVADIQSFKVMDLLKRAKELDAQGHDVVHMEAGEPDFATAEQIAAAAKRAIDEGMTQYTASAGIMPLREAIADWYKQRYELDIPAQRIVVTSGASGALLMVFSLLAEQGRSFMMTDPGYPCNRQFLRLIEARGQLVPVGPEHNFQLTPELINQHWHETTAGVLLASPSNPTGAVVGRDALAQIAQTVREKQGHLVVDELYHGLTYDSDAPAATAVDYVNGGDTFVINSFSKYFGMTGWRLGWMVVPEAAVPEVEKLAQNLFISPCTISQYAGLAAFEPETVAIFEQRRLAFQQRRDLLVDGLRELGFDIPVTPEGAFYVYAGASHLTDNTFDYCWSLLEEDHIACTPGLDFGAHHAEKFIRFSYTTGLDRIELMLERLAKRIAG